ncbi:MAG: PTS sugar transporter subunit IIB [Erysipelotrichaceae bacterium]
MICLIRSDERLIHGQCMQFICSDYSIKDIVVIDDMTATNPLLKSIFENAVPKAINASVYTVKDSVAAIEAAKTNDVHTLILMKHPRTLVQIRELVKDLPNELNIGPQMAKGGVKLVDYSTLAQADIEACRKLTSDGVRVFFNATGAQGSVVEWKSVEGKI